MTFAVQLTTHHHAYIARINRVLDHIRAHLGDTLDLQTLADVAHFSPWHFHRVFQAMTGETLADCVRRLRLEAAGGHYVPTAPFTGTGATIHDAWMRMYGQWLPQSGYQADDKPGLEMYAEDFALDPKTGAFSCLLCVPVRRL